MPLAESLSQFIAQFMGYGALAAPVWFVGVEEAGANSVDDLANRVRAWQSLGSGAVVDLYEYGRRLGGSLDLFDDPPRLQATWRRLIEIALTLEGQEPTREAIGAYQRLRLGRKDGQTLLTELMPLPKPTTGSWPYAELAAAIPCLSDLRAYHRAVRPQRIALLRSAIQLHAPQRVFFYGWGLRKAWQQIAGVPLKPSGEYLVGASESTRFVVMKHPVAWGNSREYFLGAATA